MTIRALTDDDIKAAARAAAEQHIPVREANDYCLGSDNWNTFNEAYRAREAQLHMQRQELAEAA
ncbi:hypothetical protein LJR074_002160 [Acidovorax sp. LjRoot74]|uniref:hypothetical protein n=1 Tax=Acidovorax sp. LjRoot74 TaxID=3342337 RepID=UPI003ECC51B8